VNLEEKIRFLEFAYAGALVDSLLRFSREGILEEVTDKRRKEQILFGAQKAKNFGAKSPKEVFTKISELFNYTLWEIKEDEKGFLAEANSCKLAAMAKKVGAEPPCNIYCLDPIEGMLIALNHEHQIEVEETLWEGKSCRVKVSE